MMRNVFVALLVVMLTASLAPCAFANYWLEDFEAGADAWTLANGTAPITLGEAPDAHGTSYWVTAGQTQRIFRELASSNTVITMFARFYDNRGTINTSRGFVGFQRVSGGALAVDSALIRVGKNNLGTYQVHWIKGGVQAIDTGVALAAGWHEVELTWTNGSFTWRVDGASGTVNDESLTVAPNAIALGYNYSNGTVGSGVDMWYDDIVVPEPCSALALGTGLIGLLGILRRRS